LSSAFLQLLWLGVRVKAEFNIQQPISGRRHFMKVLKNILAVSAAAMMVAAPVAASAAGAASKLSVAQSARVGSVVKKSSNKLVGSGLGWSLLSLLAIAAIIGGSIAATSGNNTPTSP
jgi:hypothetical protein